MAFTSADLKPVIFTPDALPQFQDKKYGESQHQRDKRAKKMKPMEPVTGAGKGGRLGASATASFVQTLFPDKIDPREDVSTAVQCEASHLADLFALSSRERLCSSMRERRTRRSIRATWILAET